MEKREKFKEKIRNSFPFKKNGKIYYLLSIDEYDDKKRTFFISVIDNEGYKYKHRYSQIMDKSRYKSHKQFFYHNPYTYDNIQNFFGINDITDIKILDDISKCTATTILNVEIKGCIYHMSWNDIKNDSNRLNKDNIDSCLDLIFARNITKGEVIDIIYKMYEEKGTPLIQDDFEGKTTRHHVGVRVIEKYFGGVANMQRELGLPVPSDYRILNDNELLLEIHHICDTIYLSEKRKVITSSDIDELGSYSSYSRFDKRFAELGTSLRDVIEEYGFRFQSPGSGMNFYFEDGEHTTSKYEYDFSRFLRNKGFIYNQTYFRDVWYKTFTNNYSGNMNCDYVISNGNDVIYVELAGMLGNKEHQIAFRDNTHIYNSKAKETYRLKLNKKKELFEKNNLTFYILLPDEMNENTYIDIINKNFLCA